jgi:hypothetical protein
VDTAGYNSCWSNDIKEVKAGLIAPDSSEEDLDVSAGTIIILTGSATLRPWTV